MLKYANHFIDKPFFTMTPSERDTLYNTQKSPEPFRFDDKVAAVFPDMIQRSVPGYQTIIQGIAQLSQTFAQPHSSLYDLGCSLGAVSMAMSRAVDKDKHCRIIAIDKSQAMIERCQPLLDAYKQPTPIELICQDITQQPIENASIVVINFTLQFIAPEDRALILKKIHDGMLSGGLLILSEKIQSSHPHIETLLTQLHHQFKRDNGYSELEVSQKRSALEKVLIPETAEQHLSRLLNTGFSQCELWFKQFNFCSFLAIKP